MDYVCRIVSDIPRLPRNLPARNRNFVGRDDLLAALHAALEREGAVTLLGPGGIGKTQLAVEYAHRYHAAPAAVVVLRAADPALLALDQALVLEREGVQGLRDLPAARERTRAWLAGHRDRLLLLEDADDVSLLEGQLPERGRVLVLSRGTVPAAGSAPFPVPPFARDESLRFLRGRLPQAGRELSALAAALDDHPLALALAAAFLRGQRRPPRPYIERLRRRRAGEPTPAAGPVEIAHLFMWEPDDDVIFLPRLPCAPPILNLCACYQGGPIPLGLLHPDTCREIDLGGWPIPAGPREVLDYLDQRGFLADFLGDLQRLGFVDLDLDGMPQDPRVVTMPRLLQELWQGQENGTPRRDFVELAARCLLWALLSYSGSEDDLLLPGVTLLDSWRSEYMSFDSASDTLDEALTPLLLSHGLRVAAQAESEGVACGAVLLYLLGDIFLERKELAQAERLFLRSLRLAEAGEPAEEARAQAPRSLWCLAEVRRRRGDLRQAHADAERCLHALRQLPEASTEDLAQVECELGALLCALGQSDAGRGLLAQAASRVAQPDDRLKLWALGDRLHQQGRRRELREMLDAVPALRAVAGDRFDD